MKIDKHRILADDTQLVGTGTAEIESGDIVVVVDIASLTKAMKFLSLYGVKQVAIAASRSKPMIFGKFAETEVKEKIVQDKKIINGILVSALDGEQNGT
jgi:hypothetical protein